MSRAAQAVDEALGQNVSQEGNYMAIARMLQYQVLALYHARLREVYQPTLGAPRIAISLGMSVTRRGKGMTGRHREAGVRVSSADWFKAGVARQRADPISLRIAPPRVYDSE